MRRADRELEHLDGRLPIADRDASLADIDRLNAWFGGYALTTAVLRRVARRVPPSHRLLVLDVGGGRGDFARRLVAGARRLGRRVHVVVVDRDPDLLAGAAAGRTAHPGISLVRADATALPFRARAADVVTMSLTLHHLPPDAAVMALAEMRAAARLAVVVNDLLRTRITLALVWIATRLVARHRVSRHDGPLSVRRAYSPSELSTLAGKAGIHRLSIQCHRWLGRLVAVSDA